MASRGTERQDLGACLSVFYNLMNDSNTIKEFPPGSKKAQDKGCKCPVIDNHYGAGAYGKGLYWIHEDCPLHSKLAKDSPLKSIPYKLEDRHD